MKVVLTWYATELELAQVRRGLPPGCVVVAPAPRPHLSRFEVSHEDLADLCPDAGAFMGWVVPPESWHAAARLEALVWFHAGCDELDLAMLRRRGIQVSNVRGGNAVPVAEHAMALMLGIAKRVAERHRWVRKAQWQPIWDPAYIGARLEGRTLAVVGLGTIGTAVAKRARGFDMRIVGVRRHPERGGEHVDAVHGPGDLHAVLAEADFVMLAAPLTRETVGFIDAEALRSMKRTAFLINIARGNLVVEQALHEALTTQRIAGYAADVWWNYTNSLPATYHFPIPSRTGLHRLPNVLASGDQASNVEGVSGRLIDLGTESLAAFARGEPMPRAIDLELGY